MGSNQNCLSFTSVNKFPWVNTIYCCTATDCAKCLSVLKLYPIFTFSHLTFSCSHLHFFSSHLLIFTSSRLHFSSHLTFSSSHLVIFICLHALTFTSYIFTSSCYLISPVHGRYLNGFALLHSTACDCATDFNVYFQWHTSQHFPLASGKRRQCPESTLIHVVS